ncbi:hypothetical protein HQ545_02250 [Candidatus Woesearchaeota archaeon]|nr:hypothetical protein [Candidatus Woesearchaeota archaeon]
MQHNIVKRYFENVDSLVVNGRIYNIILEETPHSFEFMGAKFGLVNGPLLNDIEYAWKQESRDDLISMFDDVLGNMLRDHVRPDIVEDDEKRSVLVRGFAKELSRSFSLAHIMDPLIQLKHSKNNKSRDSSKDNESPRGIVYTRDVLEARKDIIENYICNSLKKTIKGDVLFLGGCAYKMRSVVNQNRTSPYDNINVMLGEKRLCIGENYEDLDRIVESFKTNAKLQIQRTAHNDKRVRDYVSSLGCVDSIQPKDLPAQTYNKNTNIGWMDKSDKFFIFTQIPPYILLEKNSGSYFKFPPATVAVEMAWNDEQLRVSTPIVVEKYKHPALKHIDKPMQYICVEHFHKKDIFDRPLDDQVHSMLESGCSILMKNYHSGGKAFFNLEDENYRDLFADRIVTQNVNLRYVTNMHTAGVEYA